MPGLFLRRQSHRRFVVVYLENVKSWPFLIVQDEFGHSSGVTSLVCFLLLTRSCVCFYWRGFECPSWIWTLVVLRHFTKDCITHFRA
jgi:hypothetical protein